MDAYGETSSGRSSPVPRSQPGPQPNLFRFDPAGFGESSAGRSSSPGILPSNISRFDPAYGGCGPAGFGESSAGRSSSPGILPSNISRFDPAYGGCGPGLPQDPRIQSGAYNPTPVASINAMPYPFSAMGPPQRLMIPTSAVLDRTRPHEVRTPRSTRAVNFDIDAVSDDEDATYTPAAYKLPPSRKVVNYIDDILNDPGMESVEEETKKIRRDAEAMLKRLHTPRISGIKDFNTYDYSNVYRLPPPVAVAAHNYATNEDYEDEDRFSPLRTRPRRPLSQYLYARDRSPDLSLTKIQTESARRALYGDSACGTSSLSSYSSSSSSSSYSSGITRSSSFQSSFRRIPSHHPDVDSVKNNIAARARYASTRAAAAAGIRKKNDYLMT